MNSRNIDVSSLLLQQPKPCYASSSLSGFPSNSSAFLRILAIRGRRHYHCPKPQCRWSSTQTRVHSLRAAHARSWQVREASKRELQCRWWAVRAGEADETADEEQGQGDVSESETSEELSGWNTRLRKAIYCAVVGTYRQFLEDLEQELGFNFRDLPEKFVHRYERLKEALKYAWQQTEAFRQSLEEAKEQGISARETVRWRLWSEFVAWNQWKLWQNVKQWDLRRIGALLLYVLLIAASFRGAYMSIIAPFTTNSKDKKLANMYMEAIFPEYTPQNLHKLKKACWRQPISTDLRERLVLGSDGEHHRDVARDFWKDHEDEEGLDMSKIIEENTGLTAAEKDAYRQLLSDRVAFTAKRRELLEPAKNEYGDEVQTAKPSTWQAKRADWTEVLERETWADTYDREMSEYDIPIALPKYRENVGKGKHTRKVAHDNRAFWVRTGWWKYRPELPYTYFLEKVHESQVEAAVYNADATKLYITMRDGFPSEYVVKVPADPYLSGLLSKNGVEVDVLQRSSLSLLARTVAIVLPTILIFACIRAVMYRLRATLVEGIYDVIHMNTDHLVLPEAAEDMGMSQYKDVVMGGDVWLLLEEILTYMRDPMIYYNREVKIPRGILISGPPGTGKTLLARAIARESGLPFVFASGAEFVDSRTGSGRDKVYEIFFTARANAPSFIFIDEIDALAGRHAEDDPARQATFRQLLAELDAEAEHTDVDRFALRQAFILICATNRPDELHDDFLRPGRIDREVHIGLPGEKERMQIFDVHSAGKRLADDVDFSKLVFRTLGYSGADIRNLINEAAIMAVRKGHDEVSQQDFVDVLEKQLFEGLGVVLTEDEQLRAEKLIPLDTKRLMAVHEAGHILLAHVLPRFDWHAFTHLMPGGSESALTVYHPRQEMREKGYTTVGYLKMQMVVAHGGRCAERLLIGEDISDGGQDDLAQLSRIAREITISRANPWFGLVPLTLPGKYEAPKLPDEVQLIPRKWDDPSRKIAHLSVELSELFTREVTRYIEETEHQAFETLSKNRHILEKLVGVLLTRTKISGLEVEDIVKGMNPIMLPDLIEQADLNLDKMDMQQLPDDLGYYKPLDVYPAPLHRC